MDKTKQEEGVKINPLLAWIAYAVIVERVVEILGNFLPVLSSEKVKEFGAKYISVKLLIALVFGVVLAYGSNLCVFEMFNFDYRWPYIGEALASIFIMAGSHYVHDLINTVNAVKQQDANN